MFIRKIGKFLRGSATPFQIISATVLGGLLGALPGLGQGPLLFLTLLFLVIILNANLFLAGITLLLVKLVTLILLPVYFQIGIFLLEGPLGNLVAIPVNAPVTAWFGLEYYVMLPSLIVGGLMGFFLGLYMCRALASFRKRMASLESGSDKYQAYTSKAWVKFLAWLTVGGLKGKKSWSELSEGGKRGLPVRKLGIILVVSLAVLIVVGLKFLDTTIVTSVVRDQLEKANGATVDVGGVEIQPGQNRVILTGLAMADPENLQTNRFAAAEIIADISGMNLLAKKVVVDSLEVVEPRVGTQRRIAGRRTIPVEEVMEEEEAPAEEGVVSIDDYLGKASVWKERLATIKRFYERIAPYMEKEEGEEVEAAKGLSWRDRLAQRAQEEGYAQIKADSLIRKSPRLQVRQLTADNLEIGGNDDIYNISGSNLSTQPALLEESGRLSVARGDGDLEVKLGLPDAAAPARSSLQVRLSGLEVSELEAQAGQDLPMEGGSMDISGDGSIENGVLDVPLQVTLMNTTVNAFGTQLPLDNFPLEVRLYGPLEDPKLKIPQDALKNAATKAGKGKVEELIKEKGGEELKKLLPFGN